MDFNRTFRAADFSRREPGGRVMTTKALTKLARDVMGAPVVTVEDTDSLGQAARIMVERNIGCLPVVDASGKFVGMVTERSFQGELAGVRPAGKGTFHERVLQELYISGGDDISTVLRGFDKARAGIVAHAMVKNEPTATEDMELWRVADLMLKSHLSHIAILRGGRPVGIIARHDLLKAYASG
jgi:CBS domain-containing protein